ncbi:unnamed protein product, partial [marine sediment metagenome]
ASYQQKAEPYNNIGALYIKKLVVLGEDQER